MKKRIFIIVVALVVVGVAIGAGGYFYSNAEKLKSVNDVLGYATPGRTAQSLQNKCDSAFWEGSLDTFLAKSVDLDAMQIELSPTLSETTALVWTFRGLNDVAVVQFDRAFGGTQKVVATKRVSIPALLGWQVEKWEIEN